MPQDDHSRPQHHGSHGQGELVQHVHLVSFLVGVTLEALANFNTQWMGYNVLHFPRCTSRSPKKNREKNATRRVQRVTCVWA